jgi:hypothetical protein
MLFWKDFSNVSRVGGGLPGGMWSLQPNWSATKASHVINLAWNKIIVSLCGTGPLDRVYRLSYCALATWFQITCHKWNFKLSLRAPMVTSTWPMSAKKQGYRLFLTLTDYNIRDVETSMWQLLQGVNSDLFPPFIGRDQIHSLEIRVNFDILDFASQRDITLTFYDFEHKSILHQTSPGHQRTKPCGVFGWS